AVADVLLHDDCAELRAEQRAGRTHVETSRVRAVLADVAGHQPAQRLDVELGCVPAAVQPQRLALLDECNVTPRVRAKRGGVVVTLARPHDPVLGNEVPLLARDLARLAADADRRIREEAHPRLRLVAVCGAHDLDARSLLPATRSRSAGPRGRRPGW